MAVAGNPGGAHYSTDNTNIFWFALISDTHIGNPTEEEDSARLNRFFEESSAINPMFIINGGDLTDHIRCAFPFDPWSCDPPGEWSEYRGIVDTAGMSIDVYSDVPGNHDQYNEDVPLTRYLANSVQGRALNQTQGSWLYTPSFGKYHFITVATPHPDYTSPILDGLAGTPGGLSVSEITFIENELISYSDANLTFVFGHHPIDFLITGRSEFISLLQSYGISLFGHGHTHFYSENYGNKLFNLNVPSLWEQSQYAVIAVDNDGVSVASKNLNQFPTVLITAPIDKNLGGENPYAYPVPISPANPIRALVFDDNPVTSVQYRINGGPSMPMERVSSSHSHYPYLWQTTGWDTTSLPPGDYVIQVEATGSTVRSDEITVTVCDDTISVDTTTYPDLVINGCNFSSDALVAFISLTGNIYLETPASVTSTQISVAAPRDALFMLVVNFPSRPDYRVSDVVLISITPEIWSVDETNFPSLTITGNGFNTLMLAIALTETGEVSILNPDSVDPFTETVVLTVNNDTCIFALLQFPYTEDNISNIWYLCNQ